MPMGVAGPSRHRCRLHGTIPGTTAATPTTDVRQSGEASHRRRNHLDTSMVEVGVEVAAAVGAEAVAEAAVKIERRVQFDKPGERLPIPAGAALHSTTWSWKSSAWFGRKGKPPRRRVLPSVARAARSANRRLLPCLGMSGARLLPCFV